jgi:CheY-like chemotaxis protein
VGEVLDALKPEIDLTGVRLVCELDSDVHANVAGTTIRLVVSNLVRNALEAMENGGTIRVALAAGADEARLTITDDGPGMSPRTLARAFERYFTTKERGTGLGLALVRDAIYEAGGRLEVESGIGKGTRFEVVLPAGEATTLRPPPLSRASGIHPKPGTLPLRVLVVDDDSAVRSMIATALELQGARVHASPSCEDARTVEGDFDLALVDLSLGDGRGDELIAELRASGRVERAMLLTGSSEGDLSPAGEPDAVLRKPFELDDLVRAIDHLLARAPLGAQA